MKQGEGYLKEISQSWINQIILNYKARAKLSHVLFINISKYLGHLNIYNLESIKQVGATNRIMLCSDVDVSKP
jgi:hypothetical protein